MASSLLSSHLEQISLCASSIGSLTFSGPKTFTNALLAPHDITALIRDTEAHERALFSLAPPPVPSKAQVQQFSSNLSGQGPSQPPLAQQAHQSSSTRPPRRQTAVAAVLGGDLYRRIRNGGAEAASARYRTAERGDVDVHVLLEGAEKLCNVYPLPGAFERIASMRRRYSQLTANIAHYEQRVADQTSQLSQMYASKDSDEYGDDIPTSKDSGLMTEEDLRVEEEEVRALELKKKSLEDRVTGMEKDIGGLMR